MGTKNNPGAFDCYANAEPDEPMFVLLGRDPMAPALVNVWADMREAHGEDVGKVAEARDCAEAMRAHLNALGKRPVNVGGDYSSQAMAWGAVWDLCRSLGMSPGLGASGIECVSIFIKGLAANTAASDCPLCSQPLNGEEHFHLACAERENMVDDRG